MRILKLICLATAFAGIAAAPALAQATDTDTVSLSGTQAQTCTLGAFSAGAATGALVVGDFGAGTLTLTGTMSSSTAIRAAGSITLNATAMCNYGHNVSVRQTGGGLINASDFAPTQGTFVRKQGYAAAVTWATETITASSSDVTTAPAAPAAVTSLDKSISGAAAGTLSLTLSVAASASPVVAGAYSDSVVVQIGADL